VPSLADAEGASELPGGINNRNYRVDLPHRHRDFGDPKLGELIRDTGADEAPMMTA
jgi:hypothetical protein